MIGSRAAIAVAVPLLMMGATTLGAQTAHHGRPEGPRWLEPYREPAARLIGEAVGSTFAWQRLSVLTDTIGNRLSGTPALERAIQWAVAEMKNDGLDNVHTEKAMVPHWVRGAESADILEPTHHPLMMLGLGDSVGTPAAGVQGDVIVIHTFEELDARAAEVRGRIVFYNAAFTNYGETVRFRTAGPSRAARYGAVAVLVRSIGPDGLRTPHTGALNYAADAPKIPAAAVTSEDADRLQRMADRGERVVVRLKMDARFEPDAESSNVVGEIKGRERPDEIVLVGGHLDSWDVGAGATDDGGGCVVSWEALRLMKKLNLRPRRTVRVVRWTNEENGGRGGLAYRDQHRAELPKHVMMLESDSGVFRPLGFGLSSNERARETVRGIATLLSGIAADQISMGGGGADIGPSLQESRAPGMSLEVDDTKYFLIHHTPADTIDKIDPVEMAKCAAAVAVMAYVIADLPQRLGE